MNPRCLKRVSRNLHRTILHVVLHGDRIAAARQTNCRLVHDDITEPADDLPITLKIARCTSDIAGIETDTKSGIALLHNDNAHRCSV